MFMFEKENTKHKEIFHLVDLKTKQLKQFLNSRIYKRVNCINWELKFLSKSTMSSVNIYFRFYRNNKFYSKSLKHTSFPTWFDDSRI